MRDTSLLVVSALVLSAMGCAAESVHEWAGSVTDSAGIAIVHNPATGIWQDGSGWTVEEELRIGTIDDDPNYQFGQISGVGAASDGRIFVLDQQEQMVKVYSSSGDFERTIGRPGGGPGELGRGAGPLLVIGGDTVVVPDIQSQRVTLYLPDGTLAGSFRIAIESGIPLRWEAAPDAILAQLRPMALPNQPATDSTDVIVAMGSDGTVIDTLLSIPSGTSFSFAGGAPEFNLFVAEPVWAVGNGSRLVSASNDEFRISTHEPGGKLERVVTRPVERRLVGERDQGVILDALERLWEEAGVPPPMIEQLRTRVSFAEHYPAFLQFLTGVQGSLWVQRMQMPSELTADERASYNPMLDLGAPEWDVFDADGRYLGMVRMPPRFQPMRFIGDRIYGIWRDDLDVQYVKVLRVIRDPA